MMNKELEAYMKENDLTPSKAFQKYREKDIKDFAEFTWVIKIIETALKNYEELTNKPAILYGRTQGNAQALIDTICKNYKEVKITNLKDEKKLKALEIIAEKEVNIHYFKSACATMSYEKYFSMWNADCFVGIQMTSKTMLTQEEYDLLKEVLL